MAYTDAYLGYTLPFKEKVPERYQVEDTLYRALIDSLAGGNGSGTPTCVPYWAAAKTLGDSILHYDAVNSRIGLGTTTPERKMEIRASGSGNTVTYALRLTRDDG